jgi:hypothetical protein
LVIIKKIIFLSGTPISKIVGDKIDPYWYQDQDFEVEYWELQNIYYDKTAINGYFSGNSDYKYIFPNARTFSSKCEVSKALIDLNNKVIICFIDFMQQNDFWILRLFKKYNIRFYIAYNPPSIQERPSVYIRFINKYVSIFKILSDKTIVRKVNNKILNFVFRHTNYYQHPTYVFSCGIKGRSDFSKFSKFSKYISIRSHDITWTKTPLILSGKYCVYVENNFHYSPDAKLNVVDNHIVDIGLYENNICSMFDLIERVLEVKVIISASGKYIYPDKKTFGNREIVYNKTNQLIQHSEMVIGHYSLGLYQAVESLKPLMLIQDDSFSIEIQNVIDRVSEIFKINPIYIKDLTPTLIKQQFVFDKKHYQFLNQMYYREKGVGIDSKQSISNTLKKL